MKYRQDDKSKPIPVLLDKSLRFRIEQMAERMGEPKSTVMRIAMRIGLENLEKALEAKPPNSSSSTYPQHFPQGSGLNEEGEKKKKTG